MLSSKNTENFLQLKDKPDSKAVADNIKVTSQTGDANIDTEKGN